MYIWRRYYTTFVRGSVSMVVHTHHTYTIYSTRQASVNVVGWYCLYM